MSELLKKRGRPRGKDSRLFDLHTRVSEEEKLKFNRLARDSGMTISELIRYLLNKYSEDYVRDSINFDEYSDYYDDF